MSQAKIKLYIVDQDSIFRLGLRTAIAQYADFEVIGEGNLSTNTLRELTQGLVLNVMLVGINPLSEAEILGEEFTQQLRQLYPQLPLFLLTSNFSRSQQRKLKAWGVRGNCDRSANISTIIEGLHTVAYGNTYWHSEDYSPQLWQRALARWSKTGRIELEQTLQAIEAQLANPSLSDWERVFLMGRKRELLTTRWLSSRLVAESIDLESEQLPVESIKAEIVPTASVELAALPVFVDSANKSIFERVATEIQLGLYNRSKILLEIDILQPDAKRSLCHLLLQRLSETISQIPIANTLDRDYTAYVQQLWTWTFREFMAKYDVFVDIDLTAEDLTSLTEIEFEVVEQNIINYIYGIPELCGYLLGKPGLEIDNIIYQSDDPEAIARIEFLLHNLLIQLANGVVQVMLNNFYDLEILKYKLYQPEYRSDRALARFRNQLSWKYRQEIYLTHPQNIFESRHRLLVITSGFIRAMYVYAPRKSELEQLTGIPWLSTIVIEIRDAIAPLVRKLIALAGSSVVFVLTQVIGKAIGLIGKGIIQGIGSTLKDLPRNQKKP
ncbi:MAG: DUF3685 domain-containing protein [Cyanobacteria bacterium P01_G01_bin.39]